MTVKELIAKLELYAPSTPVVVSEHSQYSGVASVQLLELFDNGGYWSDPFREADRPKVRLCVYLGT